MIYNHTARKVGKKVQERIDSLKIGQKMQDLPKNLWHKSFKFYMEEDKNRKGGPNMRIVRLNPEEPSLTVTGFIFNKFVHPYENRYITVREASRLQGFPDDIELKGTLTSTQKQIGNAIPTQLAQAIFKQICLFAELKGFKNLNALSLFCGAGGFDIASRSNLTEKCKIKTRLAIDIWEDACNTLRGYLGNDINIVQQDIKKILNPIDFWKQNTGLKNLPDLIYGGPPCQAFSQAGKQKALDDPRGLLIFDFLRFIEEMHPKFFVMENVSNIKSINKGSLYNDIIQKIKTIGYNISSEILCAADFGAPQKRKRAIFIGTDSSLGQISMPSPTHCKSLNLLNSGLKPYTTVKEAFKNLPYIGNSILAE